MTDADKIAALESQLAAADARAVEARERAERLEQENSDIGSKLLTVTKQRDIALSQHAATTAELERVNAALTAAGANTMRVAAEAAVLHQALTEIAACHEGDAGFTCATIAQAALASTAGQQLLDAHAKGVERLTRHVAQLEQDRDEIQAIHTADLESARARIAELERDRFKHDCEDWERRQGELEKEVAIKDAEIAQLKEAIVNRDEALKLCAEARDRYAAQEETARRELERLRAACIVKRSDGQGGFVEQCLICCFHWKGGACPIHGATCSLAAPPSPAPTRATTGEEPGE